MLPQAEKQGHEGVPLFATLSLEYVHVLTHLVLPQRSRWTGIELADERDQLVSVGPTALKIAAREMLSNAPTPSIDKMVDRGSNSDNVGFFFLFFGTRNGGMSEKSTTVITVNSRLAHSGNRQ